MRPITAFEQYDRLVDSLEQAGFTHGQMARVDFSGVNSLTHCDQPIGVKTAPHSILFCQCEAKINETVIDGDGGDLSGQIAFIAGSSKLRRFCGLVTIKNALVRSNGRLEVILDQHTEIIPTDIVVIPNEFATAS